MAAPPETPSGGHVTRLLAAWASGDRSALETLMPVVHNELRRLARRQLAGERREHTLQPTALVHEAFLRLVDSPPDHWQNRVHFFGIAARLMRQVLVDHARAHGAAKRGAGAMHVSIDDSLEIPDTTLAVIKVDDALASLAALDERQAAVAELRIFAGLTVAETAAALGVSEATVARDWRLARAWLARELTR